MVVRLSALRTGRLYPRKYSWYSFLLEVESTPGPRCDRKDFMSMKNPLIPAGIEPATFRFVAQHLNHCATAVPTACWIIPVYFPSFTIINQLNPPVTKLLCLYKLQANATLTLWRRNYFFNLSTPVCKMWIIQEPNKLALWNILHFEEKKTESIEHV